MKKTIFLGVLLALLASGCVTKTNEYGITECRGVITDKLYPCTAVETIYTGAKTAYGLGKTLVLINGYWIPTDVMDNLEELDSVAKQIDVSAEIIKESIKASMEKKADAILDSSSDSLK